MSAAERDTLPFEHECFTSLPGIVLSGCARHPNASPDHPLAEPCKIYQCGWTGLFDRIGFTELSVGPARAAQIATLAHASRRTHQPVGRAARIDAELEHVQSLGLFKPALPGSNE